MASTIQQIETPKCARALDTSGNNNHGQLYSGRALEFDGVTDYLDLGATNTFVDFSAETTQANRAWTVVCWVKPYVITTETNSMNMIGSNVTQSINYLGLRGAGAHVNKLTIYDVGTTTWRVSNTALNINTWYRAVWVFDGDTTVSFYLNGVADGTGEIDNTGVYADMALRYIGTLNDNGRFWDGALADLQLWQGAWTASDVTYDYLNPESLVLSNGGTSLTESNLKIWYPMQDGHRGQQSYILDASNTGLGDELITNGSFTTDSDWNKNSNWTIDTTGGATAVADGSANTDINQVITSHPVANNVYKVTFDVVSVTAGSVHFTFGGATGADRNSVGTYSEYITASNTDRLKIDSHATNLFAGSIDNVSVKPVNAKNNATTVFYGDPNLSEYLTTEQKADLVDNLDSADDIMVFADAVTDGCDGDLGSEVISVATEAGFTAATNWDAGDGTWVVDGSNSNTAVRTATDITTVSTLTLGSGGTGSATANRWYVIKYDITAMSQYDGAEAAASFQVTFGGDAAQSSSAVGTHRRLVYTTDTSKPILTAGKNTTCTIDNLSIKEAQGWVTRMTSSVGASAATADNQSMDGTHGLGFANNGTINGEMVFPIKTTPGKTYRVKARSSVGAIKIGLSNNMSISNDKTVTYGTSFSGTTGYSNELQSNGTQAIYVANNVTTDGGIVRFDDLTIQEVGTASGWTDADQQLHIPQTALQSYNELAWCQDNIGEDNPYATVTDHTDFDINTSDFTVNFWVFLNSYGVGAQGQYVFQKGGGGSEGWDLHIQNNGDVEFRIHDGTDSFIANCGSGNIAIGEWNMVTGVVDYGSNVILYINGEMIETTATDNAAGLGDVDGTTHSGVLKFLNWHSTYTAGALTGTATEWSIFKNTAGSAGGALTEAEVKELYNDGKALDATTHSQVANLKGYWRNDGLNTVWKNIHNPGTHDATFSNGTEIMLIPQGLDSRDSQGFIMNRARNTSSLNLTQTYDGTVNVISDRPYVDVVDETPLTYVDTENKSYLFWIKRQSALSVTGIILGGSSVFYKLIAVTNNNNSNATITIESDTNGDAARAANGDMHSVALGDWVHVGVVVTGTSGGSDNTVEMYINGQGVTEGDNTLGDGNNVTMRYIGTAHPGDADSDRAFHGEIDGLLVYSDVLSATEVLRNYNATKGSHRN